MFSLLRRNRDVRMLFGAQVVSYLGDWFTFVALAGLVEDVTNSRFLVSLVLVSMTIPGLLTSPVAGSFADRFDRRKILIVVSLIQAVAALFVTTMRELSMSIIMFCPLNPSVVKIFRLLIPRKSK